MLNKEIQLIQRFNLFIEVQIFKKNAMLIANISRKIPKTNCLDPCINQWELNHNMLHTHSSTSTEKHRGQVFVAASFLREVLHSSEMRGRRYLLIQFWLKQL